ncbi:MAG: hypothetical protein M3T49_10660 [Candidatus Eremiobacteraeota bacterium]|nr:hypothetical protein [Candidatus Eremiobacteraeota bacterium]
MKAEPDILCLSHLRWDFVFQRPQHLATRLARRRRFFYVEEPVAEAGGWPSRLRQDGVVVAQPRIPANVGSGRSIALQREFIDRLMHDHQVRDFILWYHTPTALEFSDHLLRIAA